jgi:Skp family chaperone for outer membrane proteins
MFGIRSARLLPALCLLAFAASAQVKIAIINLQKAVLDTAEIQKAQKELEAKILSRSAQRMNDVIKKLSEGKSLDMVVDVSNAVYFKPALDITVEATAEYNKAYPVK